MDSIPKKSILIADDENDVRDLLQAVLKRSSYRILIAKDGEEALEIARKELPQLALLDVMMPRMSGLEVCRLLKNDWETSKIKIILVTARTAETDRENGRKAGADEYVTKPFSPLALLDTVTSLMEDDPDH